MCATVEPGSVRRQDSRPHSHIIEPPGSTAPIRERAALRPESRVTRIGVAGIAVALRMAESIMNRRATHHAVLSALVARVVRGGRQRATRDIDVGARIIRGSAGWHECQRDLISGDQSARGTQHEAEQGGLAGSLDDVPPGLRDDLHRASRGRRQEDSHPRAARGARQRSQDEHAAAGQPDRDLGCELPDRRRRHGPDAAPGSTPEGNHAHRWHRAGRRTWPACRRSRADWPSRRRSGCDRLPCAESTRRSRGHALPVRVESVADVKLAGSCEFSMWIDYTAVDGIQVDRAATRPSLSGTEPSHLLIALN